MIFQDIQAYTAAAFTPQVCIVGSGPAGMTVALSLARAGIPSVVLEAGSDEPTAEAQDVYRGEVIGDPYFDLETSRLRYLGGCSNHWAGWCRVLETYDFEPKSWVPETGWPIGRSDIDPFLGETFDMLEIGAFEPDRPVTEHLRWWQVRKTGGVRFGEKYRSTLEESKLIALVLNTAVQELSGDGRTVSAAKVRSRGVDVDLVAPQFVVATGGIENSRLLLWSNERSNGAVIPHAKALGRYWMEHPMFWTGNAYLTDADALSPDEEGEVFLMPSAETLERLGVMNFHVQLETTPFHGVKGFVAGMACTAPETAEWVASMLGARLQCSARVHMDWEQAPRETNRIALSATERDANGIPRVELHWRKDELDRRTMVEGMRLFGEELARNDLGRLNVSDWVRNGEDYPADMELAGNHHMGGTRMGENLATSVVDRNCQVHGVANLHVAGSSVFTTSGQCTPTTTIVALALRLGKHLAGTIRQQASLSTKT